MVSRGDPDPVPLTITPDVKVEHSKPVSLSALQQQSERATLAMEEKRKRALSFLAAHPAPVRKARENARDGAARAL
jgi:hypothetical protein